MTLAIGINFGAYVLLAADIRAAYYDWNDRTIAYRDASVKIRKTDAGLITGAGYIDLLDRVQRELAKQTVTGTHQILTTISEETQRYQSRYGGRVAHHIEKTGWIFSYTTSDNQISKLRLAVAQPGAGKRAMGLYKEHDPAVIYPAEATKEQAQEIYDVLRENLAPFEQSNSIDESVRHHWGVVTRVVRVSARMFPSVSSYLQIGVHTLDHRVAVSPIVKDTERAVSLDFEQD
ncbi:MAG: hypothetical protein ACXV49_06645 [Halobacteriota archaeon]